ncbi:MAG: DUF4389 domain-containing protein [Alphaproteobacteria bacterium]|nr:DUF4389 domain-containing protein [Alphaproteobacteria bacterium]
MDNHDSNASPSATESDREAIIDQTELKKNVSDGGTWLRFVFMIVCGVAFYFAATLALAITLFQFVAKLFSGKVFDGLSDFGGNLSVYLGQVVSYMTFASDERPFPFAPFPERKKPE